MILEGGRFLACQTVDKNAIFQSEMKSGIARCSRAATNIIMLCFIFSESAD